MEELRPIPGLEGIYLCDSSGNIYSTKKKGRHLQPFGPTKQIKASKRRDGYLQCHFRLHGKEIAPLVHQVVIRTWGAAGHGTEVNHKNGVKSDNRIENLEWVTRSENLKHAREVLGKHQKGVAHSQARLTDSDIRAIRRLRHNGGSAASIAKKFGVSHDYIYEIANKTAWDHID